MNSFPKYLKMDKILEIIHQTKDRKTRLMIDILRKTGLRISEMLSLTPANIDPEVPSITVRTLKKRKISYRKIPVDTRLYLDLIHFIMDYKIDKDNKLFELSRQAVYSRIRKQMLKCDVADETAHPHTLRHSYAVHCLEQGLPFRYLHEYLGHDTLESTMIYTKITLSDSKQLFDKIIWE